MRELVVTIAVLLVALAGSPARAQPGSYADRRIDALTPGALLSESPARLVDPNRQRAATLIDEIQRPVFVSASLAQILVLLWLWRTGRAALLREGLRGIRNLGLRRFIFGAAVAVLAFLTAEPFRLVSYRVAYAAGLAAQPLHVWLLGYFETTLLAALATGIAVAVVFAFVDRTRLWYLWSAAFVAAVVVVFTLIDPAVSLPVAGRYIPFQRAGVLREVQGYERELGINGPPIVVARARYATFGRAGIDGLGPTARIVIGESFVNAATDPELAFAIARQEAHAARHDQWRLLGVAIVLFIVAVAIAVLVSDRIGFRRDDDPLSRLALVGSIAGILALILYPAYTAYSRSVEARADATAVRLAGRVGAIRSLVRLADERFIPLCPPDFERRYFLTIPALANRIATMQGREHVCP